MAEAVEREDTAPGDGGDSAVAPSEFPEYDENLETAYCCPKCGYEWSGKSA